MKQSLIILLTLAALLASGCGSQLRYRYVEDAPHDEGMPIKNNFDATIYPSDLLQITVNSSFPESVMMFNSDNNKSSQLEVKGYTVSQSGYILFPILGRIQAAGKTRVELGQELEKSLIEGGYVTDPVVTVELLNFHVTVIGEVANPSLIHSLGSRLTIFEALAQCGDVTMYGMRTNVVMVRFNNEAMKVDTVDLTRREILDSPYYYLQQNDIVYVEPTPKRKKEAWRESDWIQYVSLGAQSLRLAYSVINIIRVSNQ